MGSSSSLLLHDNSVGLNSKQVNAKTTLTNFFSFILICFCPPYGLGLCI